MKKVFLIWTIGICVLFLLSLSNQPQRPVVCVDPGHGGFDGGSSDSEIKEKEITLEIGQYLAVFLENSGFDVLLTRTTDKALAGYKNEDMYKRVSLINNSKALLYVSIHANSFSDSSIKGAQVFYKQGEETSKLLGETIQQNLSYVDIYNHRKAKKISGKYLVDNALVTGCLIEVGFLSNDEEATLLKTSQYQKQLAYAIYLGIISYLDK